MTYTPGLVFRIIGGIFLIVLAIGYFSIVAIPGWFIGLLALIAGFSLLAGL